MNELENEYQLKILDMAANLCLDKIATPTDENLRFIESNVDKIVWDVGTQIYQQSGFKADFARVRDIIISRLEKIRHQIQLKGERKAVEQAKREAELREQAEREAAEAQRLAEFLEQADLIEQFDGTKNKAEIFLKLRWVLVKELRLDEEKVNLDIDIKNYLGADWADMLLLSVAIEQEFEIEIPDDEAEKIGLHGYNSCRVRELLDYIYPKINDTTKTVVPEAKRLAKLREQTERKAAEAKSLAKLREQAEQKVAEAQRLAEFANKPNEKWQNRPQAQSS
jgi:acyl carrier protein